MNGLNLTPEQQCVVAHPRGRHARVLAVAGSGKTTTMVARVAHLIQNERLGPSDICVLMFNRRAREQFEDKLADVLLEGQRPKVSTFHSFAYQQIRRAMGLGLLNPATDTWTEDREELVRLTVHHAINALVRQGLIEPQSVDPEQAQESIGLWKGSLIPAARAGHRTNGRLPLVYREFERLRTNKDAITYDDFVPIAVGLLEAEAQMARGVINAYEIVIVDEYQDVNYGQQRLVELIAGQRADIMVVGDDDQTIYEWRGARPDYIISEFPRVFSGKPTVDYTLSRTFRFGPVLAQCAENVISFNQRRVPKPLIAFRGELPARIHVLVDRSEQPTDVNKELATQLKALVKATRNPQGVAVLARLFAQLAGLEAEFLVQGIPYRVEGRAPFFERTEVVSLLNYFRLGLKLHEPVDRATADAFLGVLNVPNRMIPRDPVKQALDRAAQFGESWQRVLAELSDDRESPFSLKSRERMQDLADVLTRLAERLTENPPPPADQLLNWLIRRTDYRAHYDHYYGAGEASEERKLTIVEFVRYVGLLKLPAAQLLDHIASLDTTLGVPRDEQVMMTTVFRVKGEEFEYVFIPDCKEGFMPCLYGTDQLIYDTAGEISEPTISTALESERRLFYVAITRARQAVFIGTSALPVKGAQSRSGDFAPSRFLDEIQLGPVEAVLGPYQQIVAGDASKFEALNAALARYAGHKPMMRNLVTAYAASGPVRLDEQTAQRLLAAPETPFRYLAPYDHGAQANVSIKPAAKRAWFDDD